MGKLDYATFLHGDSAEKLKEIDNDSVHACVTSPPYFGLRDYHADGQIGLEDSLSQYIDNLTEVFEEVRRVLHPAGTFWLNIGDSYAGSGSPGGDFRDGKGGDEYKRRYSREPDGLKDKDLCMVPSRVAIALQEEGWWLRSEIIWAKAISFNDKYSGSCMPESATDRPTNSHEKLFLLSKSSDYFYDEAAVAQPIEDMSRLGEVRGDTGHSRRDVDEANRIGEGSGVMGPTKKLRNVWTFNPASFSGAHFATYPLGLVEPCVKAGTSAKGVCSECGNPYERVVEKGDDKFSRPERNLVPDNAPDRARNLSGKSYEKVNRPTDQWEPTCDCDAEIERATVLDPFSGAATTGIAALKHGRKYVGIDVNEEYIELAKDRIREHKDVPTNHDFW